MVLIKFLGLVDILAAVIIFFGLFANPLTIVFFVILIAKGLASMGADIAGKFLGVVDIAASFVIVFGIELHVILKSVIVIILLLKGAMSLV